MLFCQKIVFIILFVQVSALRKRRAPCCREQTQCDAQRKLKRSQNDQKYNKKIRSMKKKHETSCNGELAQLKLWTHTRIATGGSRCCSTDPPPGLTRPRMFMGGGCPMLKSRICPPSFLFFLPTTWQVGVHKTFSPVFSPKLEKYFFMWVCLDKKKSFPLGFLMCNLIGINHFGGGWLSPRTEQPPFLPRGGPSPKALGAHFLRGGRCQGAGESFFTGWSKFRMNWRKCSYFSSVKPHA